MKRVSRINTTYWIKAGIYNLGRTSLEKDCRAVKGMEHEIHGCGPSLPFKKNLVAA